MNSILWFRKGLRLHDNLALLEAIKGEVKNFYPVFVLDPHFMDSSRIGENRMRFLLQTLRDLDSNLRKKGSRLFVLKGKPVEVFPSVFKRWHIQKIAWEKDTEPYALIRDKQIEKLAKDNKIDVAIAFGHTLYDLDILLKKNNGKPPMTYKGFQTLMGKAGMPQRPKDAPDKLPPFEMTKEDQKNDKSENWLENYSVPNLGSLPTYPAEEEVPEIPYKGGETIALERMEKYLTYKKEVLTFSKPDTNAASMPKAVASALNGETTVLSPYIKFGSLSSRLFYWKLKDMYAKDSHSLPPVSLEGQLIWREFFYTAAYATPNFDKMVGNPICKQIPWTNDEKFIEAWKNAKTGFPWIDAIMTQLRTEGWIHHLARHSVACFLTRGDLWVSWEKGRDIFDLWLLDDDWSLNNANWMWLSCSSFFYKYFRVYSPVAFAKKYDPEGKYIKKYLPVLKNMPAKYILEPWKAPESVQKTAKCIIGKDYPKPIVDHAVASKKCINAMKEAYANQSTASNNNNSINKNEDDDENENEVEDHEETKANKNKNKNSEKKNSNSDSNSGKILGQKRKASEELNKDKKETKKIKISK